MCLGSLGQTTSARSHDHLLQTSDTFVRTALPGIQGGAAIVHASAAMGAGFVMYTAELEKHGTLAPATTQRFVYVIGGSVRAGDAEFTAGGYCFLPAATELTMGATEASRLAVIEKPYRSLHGVNAPLFFAGHESDISAQPLGGDQDLLVRSMVPDELAYDFAVNTMTYSPGASLSMVEIHVMEHGLLMLEGGGIYRLNDRWYPVTEGDFIWMAPYCPQWFGAIGKKPAKYLIYKDWNRHPL
jgi:(S)-ureidoglycine aminohydrolase